MCAIYMDIGQLLIYCTNIYRVGQKTDHCWKCITPVYDDVGRRLVYQNVLLCCSSGVRLVF